MTGTSRRSYRVFALAAAVSMWASGCCCPCPFIISEEEQKVIKMREKVAALKAEARMLKAHAEGMKGVAEDKGGPYVVATLAPGDLERALKNALPISFPAKRLSEHVGGTVVIEKMRKIRLRDNRVKFVLSGRGKKLKLKTAVPPPYDKMAKELIAGLKAGLSIDVNGSVHAKDGDLLFLGKATSVALKKKNKAKYRNLIKGAVNQRFFAKPHKVQIAKVKQGSRERRLRSVFRRGADLAMVFR